MPPILQANHAIKEVVDMYLNVNQKASLPKHSLPILGDRAKFTREGKVMKRHRTEDVRLPYLLKLGFWGLDIRWSC